MLIAHLVRELLELAERQLGLRDLRIPTGQRLAQNGRRLQARVARTEAKAAEELSVSVSPGLSVVAAALSLPSLSAARPLGGSALVWTAVVSNAIRHNHHATTG